MTTLPVIGRRDWLAMLGVALNEVFVPLLKKQFPEIVLGRGIA